MAVATWRQRRLAGGVLGAFAAAALSGCGPSGMPLAKVSGRVTVGGQPAMAGRIYFVPEQGPSAAGMIDAGGRYRLFDARRGGRRGAGPAPRLLWPPAASSRRSHPRSRPPSAAGAGRGELSAAEVPRARDERIDGRGPCRRQHAGFRSQQPRRHPPPLSPAERPPVALPIHAIQIGTPSEETVVLQFFPEPIEEGTP